MIWRVINSPSETKREDERSDRNTMGWRGDEDEMRQHRKSKFAILDSLHFDYLLLHPFHPPSDDWNITSQSPPHKAALSPNPLYPVVLWSSLEKQQKGRRSFGEHTWLQSLEDPWRPDSVGPFHSLYKKRSQSVYLPSFSSTLLQMLLAFDNGPLMIASTRFQMIPGADRLSPTRVSHAEY